MSSIDYKKYIEHFEKIDRKRKTNQDTSELWNDSIIVIYYFYIAT